MINVNDFSPGITFIYNNKPYIVLSSQHAKSGRGQAHVKAKIKNLISHETIMVTFTGGDKVPPAFIKRSKYQYQYKDQDLYYFMDTESFQTIEIPSTVLGEQAVFLKEGEEYILMFFDTMMLGINFPSSIKLKVTYTENAIKGDTVGRASKPATLENNITIDVPLFTNIGDEILVDPETKTYQGRA